MLPADLPRQPSILVIDDEPDNFDVIEGFLFAEGYQVSYAASGESGFKRLKKNLPDLILLDLMMPNMDGFEFCKRFKEHPEWKHIPVIILTALGKENVMPCLKIGADDFIRKPVNSMELKARVISMLRIKFQYDALKNALKFRDEVTDMIVHDFVNPLSSIMLQTELIQRLEPAGHINQRIVKIHRSATQLHNLANDLLSYAKAESNALVLTRTSFSLYQLLEDMMTDFEELAQVRNITLKLLTTGQDHWEISGDRPLIARVITNLLSNALKFSNMNSEIIIEIDHPEEITEHLALKIKDQGHGITDDLKQKIFQKYEVGERRENVMQTGLGLAFCKLVVEAHGGTIQVTDNQPQGSIFTVKLPINHEKQNEKQTS